MMSPATTALVLVSMLASASQAEPIPPQSGYTPSQRQAIVDLHNVYRAMEPASDMADLTYDVALEAQAQVQADKCVFEHSDFSNMPMGITAGENLALVGDWATEVDKIVGDPVTRWWSEKPDYDYATGTCTAGRPCGHYKVIIKANVDRVGCGVAFCADGIAGWTDSNTGVAIAGWTVFCQYAPYVSSGLYPYTCVGPTCPAPPTTEAPAPITVVDPNAYCREAQGEGSYMSVKASIAGDVCTNVACMKSFPSRSYMWKPSPNGMPCGVGLVCIDGSCATDPTGETNTLTANCLYGDQEFYVYYTGVQYTCAEFVAEKGVNVCGANHWTKMAITCCATCQGLA